MTDAILQTLRQIEQEKNVRILYAVESGSRAWGFASPDSDYDVRYIYVRPLEEYLRVDERRDTIEGPLDDVMDFSGWDLRKTLGLLRKTNPSLMEWSQSPIVYLHTPEWERLAAEIPGYFQVKANMAHYHSMVLANWNRNLKAEQVRLKHYLYALRPILCCRWLERHSTVPPVLFDELRREVLPAELEAVVDALLERKKHAGEKETEPHIPELDAFITSEIKRIQQVMDDMPRYVMPDYEELNKLFRELLQQAWE